MTIEIPCDIGSIVYYTRPIVYCTSFISKDEAWNPLERREPDENAP